MKPIKSLHSRDSVSGELSQSLLDYQRLVLRLCVDVDWSDVGQKSGKDSIIGMGECAAEPVSADHLCYHFTKSISGFSTYP